MIFSLKSIQTKLQILVLCVVHDFVNVAVNVHAHALENVNLELKVWIELFWYMCFLYLVFQKCLICMEFLEIEFEIFFVWGMLSFREVHLDVDQSTTRTLGTNAEDTTSAYGKMRVMFVKTLVHHHPNTQSLNADASIAPELLSGLKVSGHINNFLWLQKLLLLTLIFTMSVSFMFLLFMSLPKLHHGATRERWKVGKDNFQILNTGKDAGREDGGGVDSSQQLELVLKLPKNITELRAVRETLLIYQKEHQQQVELLSVCLQLNHCST